MTDDERAVFLDRKDVELEEKKRIAAKSKKLHQLLHKDPKGFLQELGLLKKP
jgi:hypothetical protein